MTILDLARRVSRRVRRGLAAGPRSPPRRPPRSEPARPSPPPPDPDEEIVEALLALGFDGEGYRTDYPGIGAHASDRDCARHFHKTGRGDWLRIRFTRPFAEAQAKIVTLALDDAQKDRLRIDLAASLLWQADISGAGAITEDLLRANPAYRPLAIISDSHGQLYLTEEMIWAGGWVPVPMLCTGCSARGLGNPDSRAQAGPRIREHLHRLASSPGAAVALLKFGQVDLEFVYDYRRVRDGRRAFDLADAEAFARDSARRYLRFLRELQDETPIRLIVTAALPPALNDAALREGYMNAHIVQLYATLPADALREELQKLDMPDWRTRTGLAAVFNAELAAGCEAAGLVFYDDFNQLLGPDGLIAPDLLVWHGGTDHHICATSPAARAATARAAAGLAALADRLGPI
jgi:hypothetical protein